MHLLGFLQGQNESTEGGFSFQHYAIYFLSILCHISYPALYPVLDEKL